MPTNVVPIGSDLKRKKWMLEGLIQAASISVWGPYTGTTSDSVIHQVNNKSAEAGHNVTFQYDGNLAGSAVKGKTTARGKGEQKKLFSSSTTVDRYRIPVDNGDAFDAVDVNNLGTSQHGDSRKKLADLFIRWKDQMIFDAMQGYTGASALSHSIQVDASSTALTYTNLVAIEKSLRTGTGFKTGAFGSSTAASNRAPLKPFRLADGRSMWVLMIDPFTAANIKGNTASGGIMTLSQYADVRGQGNRIFKGLLGTIGQLMLVESESFFGTNDTGNALEDTEVEICGMRQWDSANTAWSGEAAFANAVYSRNLLIGSNAIQMAFGKDPDYKFKSSDDFDINSESAVEFWCGAQRTKLTTEDADYKKAKRADLDNGVIALDVKIA